MASGGFRLGAWDYLQWKHVSPITNDKGGEDMIAELLVYADEPEEYYTFITPSLSCTQRLDGLPSFLWRENHWGILAYAGFVADNQHELWS